MRYYFPIIIIIWTITRSFGVEQKLNTDEVQKDTYNGEIVPTQTISSIKIIFDSSSFKVLHLKKNDTVSICVPFQVDRDKRVPCKNCLRIHSREGDTFESSYFLTDSMFLLPILDFNEKLILFGLNFPAKDDGLTDGTTELFDLRTSLNSFLVSTTKNKIITTQNIKVNDEDLITEVVSDFWQISGSHLSHTKQLNIKIPSEIQKQSRETIKVYLTRLLLSKM